MIDKEKQLKAKIKDLNEKLEEVVTENSQKIIELYRFKNFIWFIEFWIIKISYQGYSFLELV